MRSYPQACAECGAPVRYRGRQRCWRCRRRIKGEEAKATCPVCGQGRVLNAQTGRCAVCSRACADCGAVVRPRDRTRCHRCQRRHQRQQALRPCPRCGKPRLLREETGWCATCSRPPVPKKPLQACKVCGQQSRNAGRGLCGRCWQRHPGRPFIRAETLIASLQDPPGWLRDFAAHVAAGYCPARACLLITGLGKLLTDGGPGHPQALLERSQGLGRGRSPGTLARALEGFFLDKGLALPSGQDTHMAAGRRQRRIDAVPAPLRPAAAAFAYACLQARERARRAGTRPRADRTIENRLSAVRDLAIFLITQRGKDDWATADVHDIEAFLSTSPASRKTRLTTLRHFFTWARASKLVLVDPTRGLTARGPRGFRGPTAALATQRQLFRRWTTGPGVHPHEALTGLLALLHGATCEELRGLTTNDINPADRTAQLGRRPQPTPLDPASWAAIERCLAHRNQLRTANPHLLVTRQTKASQAAASAYYLSHILGPAGVRPRLLRSTRLAELVTSMDPKLVSAAFGMHPEGATHYLADHVDHGLLEPRTRAT